MIRCQSKLDYKKKSGRYHSGAQRVKYCGCHHDWHMYQTHIYIYIFITRTSTVRHGWYWYTCVS